MIRVRLKSRPNEWVTYASEKEILDLRRWGSVLEVEEFDLGTGKAVGSEDVKDAVVIESDDKEKASPEREVEPRLKRRSRKTKTEEGDGVEA